ncbi:hypothetical protein FRX31_013315 [Thalictrum thalictroides]|uniref:Zinc knuckle (CCHC-type) family protein n=1 Tax=Thalictrum thalictroides TaxID=46969 RepID=A0A7J6WJF1_THATH|nr:hypothetical protein FRX31_013315 [Thalictrum thalictroides]
MIAANVRFETIPLWMSFRGLELEHMHTDTVRMIGSAAGIVRTVLPVGVIPRTAEGYRARVDVFVHLPVVQGYTFNTLTKGDVWIYFRYNNLPSFYCVICNHLGHNRSNCNTPPPTNLNFNQNDSGRVSQHNPIIGQVVTFPDDSKSLLFGLIKTYWENMGLNSTGSGPNQGIQQKSVQSGTKMNLGLYPNVGSRFDLPSRMNINRGGTLTINEPIKGKGKAIDEDYGDYEKSSKKRKLINEDGVSFGIAYVPEKPQIIHNQRNRVNNITEERNYEDFDLMSQLIANPALTTILLKKGAINPKIVKQLTKLLSTPISRDADWPSSPTSVLQGPTTTETFMLKDDAQILDLLFNKDNPTINANPPSHSPSPEATFTTRSPSGGFEQRNLEIENVHVQCSKRNCSC